MNAKDLNLALTYIVCRSLYPSTALSTSESYFSRSDNINLKPLTKIWAGQPSSPLGEEPRRCGLPNLGQKEKTCNAYRLGPISVFPWSVLLWGYVTVYIRCGVDGLRPRNTKRDSTS